MNATALRLVPDAHHQTAAASSPRGQSHSTRLLAALDAADRVPLLSDARREFATLAARPAVSEAVLVSAIASEPALAAALLRFANRYGGAPALTPSAALTYLGRERARSIALELPTFALGERTDAWTEEVSRWRAHGLAVARLARVIARETGDRDPERAATAALFHDVGRLVIARTNPADLSSQACTATPAERVEAEVRKMGVDHAAIGGVVARRWSLPRILSSTVEHHHDPSAVGLAGIVRLADLLVHHAAGARITTGELRDAAARISLPHVALTSLMYAGPEDGRETDAGDPCPLTPRQLELIRALGQGRQYKEIAHDLGLSPSTIRSHLHFAYERLGVSDRAQAVLMASSRGWIGPVAIRTR